MKKIMYGVTLIAIALLLSGCGTKTLTCTKETTSSAYTTTEKMTIIFENDSVVNKMHISLSMKVADSYQNYMSTIESSIKSAYAQYDDEDGITVDTTVDGTTVKVEMDVVPSELSDDAKTNLDMDNFTGSYSKTKEYMGNEGYSCE